MPPRRRAHPRPIATELAPVVDLDADQPEDYGLMDGRRVTMDLTNRLLTPLEMRRFHKTGKLPKDVQLVPHVFPPIYGTPDPDYPGGWGLRYPDGKTGHAHGDGIDLWVREGECLLCDTQDFEAAARLVRAGSRHHFHAYCTDALTPLDEPQSGCGWCDDKLRECKCECHHQDDKEWDDDLQRHARPSDDDSWP